MTEQLVISDIRGTSLQKELTGVVREMSENAAGDAAVTINCRECDEHYEGRTTDLGPDVFVMRHAGETDHYGYDVGIDITDPLKEIDVSIEIET